MWFPAKITWIPGCFPFSTNSYGSFCIIAARWAETFSAWRMMSWNLCRRGVFASPDELGWLSHQFSNISQWTMVGAMQLQSDFPNHITHGFYGVFFLNVDFMMISCGLYVDVMVILRVFLWFYVDLWWFHGGLCWFYGNFCGDFIVILCGLHGDLMWVSLWIHGDFMWIAWWCYRGFMWISRWFYGGLCWFHDDWVLVMWI